MAPASRCGPRHQRTDRDATPGRGRNRGGCCGNCGGPRPESGNPGTSLRCPRGWSTAADLVSRYWSLGAPGVVGADVACATGGGVAAVAPLVDVGDGGLLAGGGVAAADGRAAGAQRGGVGGAAVAGQRLEVRRDVELVAVDAVGQPPASGRVPDQVVPARAVGQGGFAVRGEA